LRATWSNSLMMLICPQTISKKLHSSCILIFDWADLMIRSFAAQLLPFSVFMAGNTSPKPPLPSDLPRSMRYLPHRHVTEPWAVLSTHPMGRDQAVPIACSCQAVLSRSRGIGKRRGTHTHTHTHTHGSLFNPRGKHLFHKVHPRGLLIAPSGKLRLHSPSRLGQTTQQQILEFATARPLISSDKMANKSTVRART